MPSKLTPNGPFKINPALLQRPKRKPRRKVSNGFAWWDNERNEFCHVYPSRKCVEVCSPDGFKRYEAEGKGKILPVKIMEMS